jgi:hypothetical protein
MTDFNDVFMNPQPSIQQLTAARRSPFFHRFGQRHVYQVLTQKPHPEFVGPQYLSDEEVVRTVVTAPTGELACARSGSP